jgi:hypothetical protein
MSNFSIDVARCSCHLGIVASPATEAARVSQMTELVRGAPVDEGLERTRVAREAALEAKRVAEEAAKKEREKRMAEIERAAIRPLTAAAAEQRQKEKLSRNPRKRKLVPTWSEIGYRSARYNRRL